MGKTLLFPGRHLLFTQFQEQYLAKLISRGFDQLVFIVASSNLDSCRYSPIPLHFRYIQIDRFCQTLKALHPNLTWCITPIPHYTTLGTKEYIHRCLAHLKAEGVDYKHAEVLISTPRLKRIWRKKGFKIHKCEFEMPAGGRYFPATLLEQLAKGVEIKDIPFSKATNSLLADYPNLIKRTKTLWENPTTETGSITEQRDYSSYGLGMQNNIHVKFQQIQTHIKEGNISDEGCADGALLVEIAKVFQESQLFGIDLSNTFEAQFNQRIRLNHFRGLFSQFILGDLLKPQFKDGSITTSICNSTTHEIYSYGGQFNHQQGLKCVRKFLKLKFQQLQPGGMLIIRDIAHPSKPLEETELVLPGVVRKVIPKNITRQTIAERFLTFTRTFPWKGAAWSGFWDQSGNETTFITNLQTAYAFAHRFEYTDSWEQELNERYSFWTFAQWLEELEKAGFKIHAGTTEIAEPWLLQNRFSKLHIPQGWDKTHTLLIAEKP